LAIIVVIVAIAGIGLVAAGGIAYNYFRQPNNPEVVFEQWQKAGRDENWSEWFDIMDENSQAHLEPLFSPQEASGFRRGIAACRLCVSNGSGSDQLYCAATGSPLAEGFPIGMPDSQIVQVILSNEGVIAASPKQCWGG